MALDPVDAVVIGAGAGGGVIAKELACAGLRVALLERGRWVTAWDDRKDDLRNQRTSVLGAPFGPDDERNPRVAVDRRGRELVVLPSDGAYSNNAACVGSGTVSYGAMAWRYMAQDFRMKSIYGCPPGSTLDDWPITYDDLEPFYEKAEWEMGVSGDVAPDPFHAPRRRGLPMPPLPPNREYEILKPAALRKGWHPFDIPMLRNSVPYNGRGPCMRCRWCVGFACEVNAKNGTQNTVIPTALATGLCELRTDAMARGIVLDARGHATAVTYYNADNHLQTQPARLVVVSAGAIETARLLLNSKSRLNPNGLGNRYDWVGRNLQGHAYPRAVGLFDHDTYDDVGPGASVAICDFNHGNAGLRGGAMLANEFIRLPIQFTGMTPPDTPRWGRANKDYMRQFYRRSIAVMGPVQEMPVFEARAELDPRVKDFWGIPVARLSGGRHPHSVEVARAVVVKAEEWLQAAGAIQTWTNVPGMDLSGGQHQAGTCRMGNDPRTSVVDRNCRIHEADNIYLADASVHVTNGGFNPALTILANAYRVAAAIVKERRA